MQHPKEMQVVRFSMLVLFSALMVVYLLLYQIKGSQIAESNPSTDTTWDSTTTSQNLSGNSISDLFLETGDSSTSGTTNNQSGNTVWATVSLFGSVSSGTTATTSGSTTTSASIKPLSGTKIRYGVVDSVEKLWLSYQYALKDNQGMYYVYLGKNTTFDIESIVKKLGGTVYNILREDELLKNNLFWEKVSYINLPEYKNKKVVMLVTLDGAMRLFQVDYTKYYTSKTYLKTLFNQ